jgi:hypothetical protein
VGGWNKGKKITGEWLKKLSGKNNHNFGKDFSGNKSPAWKGGIRISSGGYVWIYSPYHPFRNSVKCVAKHRLVMEKHLKRFLTPKEEIHHINGIKTDNRFKNLKLFTNEIEHLKYHYPKNSKLGKNKVRKEV